MAHTLHKPPFSFVQFDAPVPVTACCDDGSTLFLPVVLDSDFAFQFSVTYTSAAIADTAMAMVNSTLQLLLLKGIGNTPATLATNTLRNWTIADTKYFKRFRTGPTQVTFTWENGFPGFANYIPVNQCFQIAISGQLESGAPAQILFSNEFKRSMDTCDTSVVAYNSAYNYADFIYCSVPDFSNRARLPFYLSKPDISEEKGIYRESSGKVRRTKSIVTKTYHGLTDLLPGYMHDRLKIALAHDTVSIESDTYTGLISESDYDVKWDDDNECTAQAEFKALATPFYIRRNNCNIC